MHGGLSTGPKTEAGKEAIRASNKCRQVRADNIQSLGLASKRTGNGPIFP
jgi:hypothetical protein